MLRSDPDIIMVGEIRDLETAKIVMQAAVTGHLVLTTLHTNDAPSTLARLLQMGVESYMISSAISGIVAQRLVRVLCEECKVEADFENYNIDQDTR
ncbi:MAG: ATPase, T2SS/T4P/T4SS family [Actinomycetota bacterium]|nr:ATPase, T2SS/T4P/T4SS family [Actinomycetota bacterium]